MEFVHLNCPKTGHLDPLFHTFTDLTRMHSNRMHTVRSSSRLLGGCVYLVLGMCVPGRGVYLVPGGVLVRGCTFSWGGVPGPRRGVPGPRGIPGPRGCTWSQGVYLVPGGYLPRYSPCGQTDRCKNITFATSLRTVMNMTGAQQNTDWFVSTCNIIFSLTIC